MTAEVVDLASRRRAPHISGPAKCLACKHEWVTVAPVGTFDLQCPACCTERGVWCLPIVDADPATAYFVCSVDGCGNDSFRLIIHPRDGWAAACGRCGFLHGVEVFGP